MQFYGFPFKDDTQFYRAVVDPSWVAGEGEEPNLEVALDAVKKAAHFNRITIVDVWTDTEETDIDFMVAVSSATKAKGEHITQVSAVKLRTIAQAACLDFNSARWMSSTYRSYELKDMNVPDL